MNRNLLTPYRKVTGKKTTTVAKVIASTGKCDLLGSFFGRGLGRFAHFHMAVYVFEDDDRVIDQPGKSQRQSAQHHAVDRLPPR